MVSSLRPKRSLLGSVVVVAVIATGCAQAANPTFPPNNQPPQ
jgi:hypothetical protein